ncbi:putative odorant receptor 85e isoform X2 [Musca domestica]|uniref:Odorant receptor n=1 Tax=Musca domestica TaxID=7370 RepID=A0ABM3VR92_MUSDO|nr:putative odorant receptor 85e isoform X2 [Musca domestica]
MDPGGRSVHMLANFNRQRMTPSVYFYGGDSDVLYSEHDSGREDDVFKLQLLFMKFMGQVPMQLERRLPLGWKNVAGMFAKSYCIFCVISNLHLAILYVKTTLDMLHNGELEEITDALTMAIIYSFSTFATCYWLFNAEALNSFIGDINANYRHHSMAGLTFVSAEHSIRLAYKVTLYWLIACCVGVVCWALAPLLLRSHTLPLRCWYPFDALPVVYEVVYATQLWCQILMGCIFGNGSALFVSVVLIMLGQFDVLYCSLKNVDYNAQLLAGGDLITLRNLQRDLPRPADDELNQYALLEEHLTDLTALRVSKPNSRPSLKEALHSSLVECVLLHQFILKSCNTLEGLFNPYCLIKSLQITLQLCLLAFVGVAGERSTMRTINLVQYLALTLSELLMFTYCGELLSSHSIRVGEAFWRSGWWLNGNLIKRDIFIFLANSKRVVVVTAGKFYRMDVQRLRSVITQAFSFLTLLQKLAEKNQ